MTKLKNVDKFYVPTWLVFAGLVTNVTKQDNHVVGFCKLKIDSAEEHKTTILQASYACISYTMGTSGLPNVHIHPKPLG